MQVWPPLQAVARWVCICITAGCPLLIHCAGCWSDLNADNVLVPRAQCFIISSEGSASEALLRASAKYCRRIAILPLRRVCVSASWLAKSFTPRAGFILKIRRTGLSSPLHRARGLSFCRTNLRGLLWKVTC